MAILELLDNGKSIKQLNIKQLNLLCKEIREQIVSKVSDNGGHLSSNLGTVELIVALHYVFDMETDKLLFDVGHQSYAHKILTKRYKSFETIRQKDGLSGFPDPQESEYDAFISGHAGNSIAAGLGICRARDTQSDNYFVIDVVGDASLFNGENLEAITSSSSKPNKFIVILNDNGMSISKNNNGLYKFVSKVTIKKGYGAINSFLARVFGNGIIGGFLRSVKRAIKRSISVNYVTDSIGLKYVGKFDGHDLKTLIKILNDVKKFKHPTFLHVNTIKGKGLDVAEKDSQKYHGVSKNMELSDNDFSKSVSVILSRQVEKYPNIHAITAGMIDGVGLSEFAKVNPKKVSDVGIQEEFAVTYAAGMATSGLKPIVFMYSTFLQRSYDQILHDVCMQNLPVVFCIDRAGFVGSDGKTHQGLFDLSYLSHMPNLKIIAPKDVVEFEKALEVAFELNSPVAIRYPNGKTKTYQTTKEIDSSFKFEVLSENDNKTNVILAVGPKMIDIALSVKEVSTCDIEVINSRCIKPLDGEYLDLIKDKNIIVLEENSKIGGFGSLVLSYYNDKQVFAKVTLIGAEDKFVKHATVNEQFIENNITIDNVKKYLI